MNSLARLWQRLRGRPKSARRPSPRFAVEALEPRILLAAPAYHAPGMPGGRPLATVHLAVRRTVSRNELGMFRVDDASGRVGDLLPGDPGYAAAALGPLRRTTLFRRGFGTGDASAEMEAGAFYGFYLIADGSSGQFLSRNSLNRPGRGPVVYFNFAAANPDRRDHVRTRPGQGIAFEDLWNLGDRDFDDAIFRVSVAPLVPASVPTPATSPIAVGPATPGVTARLLRDTAPDGRTNDDHVTFDPTVTGVVTVSGGVADFRAGLDGTPVAELVDVLDALRPDGSFTLDRSRLEQILGAPLLDGFHTVQLQATGAAGTVSDVIDLAFLLDTAIAEPEFDLMSDDDSPPVGDGETTATTATLRGLTDAGATVILQSSAISTVADATGGFTLGDVGLAAGANVLTARAVDVAGNERTFQRSVYQLQPCEFDTALTGWTVARSGGTPPDQGTVTAEAGAATLREGDSFSVTLSRTLTLPDDASALRFTFDAPPFDTSTAGAINDAFEVSVVDALGLPLVHTIDPASGAAFNITEDLAPQMAPGVAADGRTVSINLAGLGVGAEVTVVFRLVNNDGDRETSVRLTCVELAPAGGPPLGLVAPLTTRADRQAVDFDALGDVSASLSADYTRTTFDADTDVLSAELVVHNAGTYAVGAPLLAVVRALSDPSVRVRDFDGHTPQGLPYYELSAAVGDGTLAPGKSTVTRQLSFFNPSGEPFTYEIDFLAMLNRAPAFNSAPDVEALAGRVYRYTATAADPDGDAPTFALVVGPAGMTVDPATGVVTWSPTADDVGGYPVVLRVEDGRGGGAEQSFTLDVRDNVPNRPPVFTSTPVVDASVSGAYDYAPTAADEDGDPLTFTVSGPAGMTLDAATGRLAWTAAVGQLGNHTVVLTVNDGGGTATQTFTVVVRPDPENHAPVIVTEPSTTHAIVNPGTPTGTVNPDLIGLTTGETQTVRVTVTVPPNAPPGSLDLAPLALDPSALTTHAQTLRVTGTLGVTVGNNGLDGYDPAVRGTLDVVAFEDRDGDGAFDPATDGELGRAAFRGALAAGGVGTVAVPVSGLVRFVGSPIWVAVDANNSLAETDEANNTLATGTDSQVSPGGDPLPVVKWAALGDGIGETQTTPVVAPLIDTNGDGRVTERDVPAVLAVTYNVGELASNASYLIALRGDTGAVIFRTPIGGGSGGSVPSVADVDGDGRPEVFVSDFAGDLRAFNNDGTPRWTSRSGTDVTFSATFVDLDGDGVSEILDGSAVVNADGSVRWERRSNFPPYGTGHRLPVDLDRDGTPELVNGTNAYDRTGLRLWSWRSIFIPANSTWSVERSVNDGPYVRQFVSTYRLNTAAAGISVNVDADPFPEVVVVSPEYGGVSGGPVNIANAASVWIFDHDGTLQSRVPLFQGIPFANVWVGNPTVADFDGDGRPELALPVRNRYDSAGLDTRETDVRVTMYVMELDGTQLWQFDSTRGESYPYRAPVAFDFDADGAAELVFQDKAYLYILDGRDGSVRFQFAVNQRAATSASAPAIADVDNDGSVDIVLAGNSVYNANLAPPHEGVLVISDAHDTWSHARRNWNTGSYHPALVAESGAVPRAVGDKLAVQNGLREQLPLAGVGPRAAPDLSVSQVTVTPASGGNPAVLTARVGNGGSLQAGGRQSVDFYLGDPSAGGTLLGTAFTSRPLFPGDYEDVSVPWSAPSAGTITAVVNAARPNPRVTTANLSLLADTWATGSGYRSGSIIPENQNIQLGIDGSTNTRWTHPPSNTDTQTPFYEVRLPFPVEATSVTIRNNSATQAFLGTGTLAFSNGFTTTINFNGSGNGTATFPEQTGVTWVRLTAGAVGTGGPGLTEFEVGGSYVRPTFLTREGGNPDDNTFVLGLAEPPTTGASPAPVVDAGPDRPAFAGDAVTVRAAFTDAAILEAHTATVDWGDGSAPEALAVNEANNVGTATGTHTYSNPGTFAVAVTVRDAAGNATTETFTLTVLSGSLREPPIDVLSSDPSVTVVNLTGPVSGVGPNQTATFDVRITGTPNPRTFDLRFVRPASGLLGSIPVAVNEGYRYAVEAVDGDGDPVTYRLVDGPAGATLDASGFTYTPAGPGAYAFTVEAADNRGGTDRQSWVLNVAVDPNHDPVIVSVPPTRFNLDPAGPPMRTYEYAITGTDPDGDTLRYTLTTAPAGMTIDPNTGQIQWPLTSQEIGDHPVTIRVTDGRGGEATQSFTLSVTQQVPGEVRGTVFNDRDGDGARGVNEPGLLDRTVFLDANRNGRLDPGERFAVTDAGGNFAFADVVPGDYSVVQALPVGWVGTSPPAGAHEVTVTAGGVVSGRDFGALQPVAPPNRSPVFNNTPPTLAEAGQAYHYTPDVTDPDGDALTFDLVVRPAGMGVLPATGAVVWNPLPGQVGTHDAILRVRDGRGGVALQAFRVTVRGPNAVPVVTSDSPAAAVVGFPLEHRVVAQDTPGDALTFALAAAPDGMHIDPTSGVLSWTPTAGQVGTHAVTVTITDDRGGISTQTFNVVVGWGPMR